MNKQMVKQECNAMQSNPKYADDTYPQVEHTDPFDEAATAV